MAASEKVYVCGRCEDFGCPDLEELVNHMTNCSSPDLQNKDDTNQSEDAEIAMIDENGNNEEVHAVLHISTENESEKQHEETIISTPDIALVSQTAEAGRVSPSHYMWDRGTVVLLLELVKEQEKAFHVTSIFRPKEMWEEVALQLRKKTGYNVSALKCKSKYQTLTHKYKKACSDSLSHDERMRLTSYLFNELHRFFKNDARYNPRYKKHGSGTLKSRAKIIRDFRDLRSYKLKMEYINKMADMGKKARKSLPKRGQSQVHSGNLRSRSRTEPTWVKKMMKELEECHKERIQVQREMLDVMTKIIVKKMNSTTVKKEL